MADTEYVSSPHFLHLSFGDRDTIYIPLFETCHADKLFIYRTPRRLPVRDCIYFPPNLDRFGISLGRLCYVISMRKCVFGGCTIVKGHIMGSWASCWDTKELHRGRNKGTNALTISFRQTTELKRKRQFRKFTYRGIDLDQYASPRPLDYEIRK